MPMFVATPLLSSKCYCSFLTTATPSKAGGRGIRLRKRCDQRVRTGARARTRTQTRPYATAQTARGRGPSTPEPDYSRIDRNPLNALFTRIFLSKLRSELCDSVGAGGTGVKDGGEGHASATDGYYRAVMAVVRQLYDEYHHRGDVTGLQQASRRVIGSLFPGWVPAFFAAVFSRRVPWIAAWLNAVVTVGVTQWLMGPSSIVVDDKDNAEGVSVHIERCRYLESANCVGICMHSCKLATQQFFEHDMQLPLHIDPDLDDFSCRFHFGKRPPPLHEDPMFTQPCFATCTTPGPKSSPHGDRPCPSASDDSDDDNNDNEPGPGPARRKLRIMGPVANA